ncbi:O-antigen ligase family protein [Nocardioides sp.]|uniref:O-antigen ligase family protein n=1 Tax=Nocardioides sp. TaxID=35761 RepID=UPI002D0A3B5C|nr:O-antigen ligase family protein [Nocardioides sp.]HXH80922.1 O-antigen ligase family protein [Nocardioides sp.]
MTRNWVGGTATVPSTAERAARFPVMDHCRTIAGALGVAVAVFLLSNPLTVVPDFRDAWLWSAAAVTLVTLIGLTRMRRPVVPWLVLSLVGWSALSYWWSISPSITRTWLLFFVLVTVMAILVEAAVPIHGVAAGIALGAAALGAVSLWQARQALPIFDVAWSDPTYLDGVGTHRNILSYCAVFGIAALLAVVPGRWTAWLAWAPVFVLLAVTTLLTKSATGLVAVPVLVLTTVALAHSQVVLRSPTFRWRLLVAGAGVIALILLVTGPLLRALGRDATLSGRIPLWEATIEVVRARPLTGWGVGAVWPHAWLPAPANPVADSISGRIGFGAAHGHNSFIDALAEVGIIGVTLAVLCYGSLLRQAFGRLAASTEPGSADPGSADPGPELAAVRLVVLLALALLVCGLTEPVLQTPLGWFLTVLIACAAARSALRTTGPWHPLRTTKEFR